MTQTSALRNERRKLNPSYHKKGNNKDEVNIKEIENRKARENPMKPKSGSLEIQNY